MPTPNNKPNVLSDIPVINRPDDNVIARSQDAQQTSIENVIRINNQETFSPKKDLERYQRGRIVKVINNPVSFWYSQKRELEKLVSEVNDEKRYKVSLTEDPVNSVPFDYKDPNAINALPDYSLSPTFLGGDVKEGDIVKVDVINKVIESTDEAALAKLNSLAANGSSTVSAPAGVGGFFSNLANSVLGALGLNGNPTAIGAVQNVASAASSFAQAPYITPAGIPPPPPLGPTATIRPQRAQYYNTPPTTVPASNNFIQYAPYQLWIAPVYFGDSCSPNPENYKKVIDQFSVETNPRYSNTIRNVWTRQTDTFCNIFAWDVGVAMRCKIYPHWISTKDQVKNGITYVKFQPVNNGGYAELKPDFKNGNHEAVELSAPDQADWMKAHGERFGWRILSGPEEAQKVANEGRLVIGQIREPGKHVIVVRPDEKAYRNNYGPRLSQAGAGNYGDFYFPLIYGESEGMRIIRLYTFATPRC